MACEILEMSFPSTVTRKSLPDLSGETLREAAKTLDELTAWIVPLKVKDELLKLSGVIEDRGKKHPAIELGRMMKGNNTVIPMVEGEYTSDGKLRHSVQRLLQKGGDGAGRLFIIAVADNLYDPLQKSAIEPQDDTTDFITCGGIGGSVLSLMGKIPEPPALRKQFLGDSNDAMVVRQFIMRAASADDTVLIMGDTGTGKEIVAKQIHLNSPRKNMPFKAVNCAAFPHDLLESELFGHTKGAFTGALSSSEGLWAAADGGTLFLDEIGELTPVHQAKLLRALQEKSIRKVGSTADIPVNARVICATNRDLYAMVQAGQFRVDLFFRLRDFLITTPPLREHRDDIPLLATVFWKSITGSDKAVLPDDIISLLRDYSWPGNVRELKMVLNNLFGLFRTVQQLDRRHLLAVFEVQGMPLSSALKVETSAAADRLEGFSSFRRLRRVYETIRAVEHHLSPLLNGERPDFRELPKISTGIANLLIELDVHIQTPRLYSPHTFENISLLRSRLAYFISEYEKVPETAVEYLRCGTRTVIEDTVADLLAEIDRTLTEAL